MLLGCCILLYLTPVVCFLRAVVGQVYVAEPGYVLGRAAAPNA
jgi:hypothetical protein